MPEEETATEKTPMDRGNDPGMAEIITASIRGTGAILRRHQIGPSKCISSSVLFFNPSLRICDPLLGSTYHVFHTSISIIIFVYREIRYRVRI